MTSTLAAILYIPYVPESISWRPYLCKAVSGTLLESFIERFKMTNPDIDLRVLAHSEDVNTTLDDILERAGVTRIPTPYKTRSQAFLHASEDSLTSHDAFVTLEYDFAPPDLLARAFTHHLHHDNDFTRVVGFPSDCTPEIYDATFLEAMRKCTLPFGAGNLLGLAQQLVRGLENRLPASLPLAQHQTLRKAAKTLSVALQRSIKTVSFDAATEYKAHPRELPELLRIRNSTHVDIAREVISSRDKACGPLRDLRSWKREALVKQRALDSETSPYAVRHLVRRRTRGRRRKILFVSTPSAYSGAEECLCQLVGGLNRELYKPYALVGACGYFTNRLQQFGAEVIVPNRDFSTNSLENFFFTFSTLKRIKPDLVHINAASGMPVIIAARLLGIPVIYHLRVAVLQGIVDYLKGSETIIAISEFVRAEAERRDIEGTRIRLIIDGIDVDHFSRAGFSKAVVRQQLGLPPDVPIALNIARFARNKRQDMLIAASESVRKRLPDFHLVFVGEAEDQQYYSEIVEQIARAGLANNVTFLPFQRDIRRIEAASDVLVLCSDREPLGTCLLEAMAMELPIVATNSGGSHELFIDGKTGLKTPGGDVDGLAAAIESILTNPELAQELATAARRHVETKYTIQNHAKAVMDLYAEVLDRWWSKESPRPPTAAQTSVPFPTLQISPSEVASQSAI
jgi:glycosyltransferase involved in cell wall biosynthesis